MRNNPASPVPSPVPANPQHAAPAAPHAAASLPPPQAAARRPARPLQRKPRADADGLTAQAGAGEPVTALPDELPAAAQSGQAAQTPMAALPELPPMAALPELAPLAPAAPASGMGTVSMALGGLGLAALGAAGGSGGAGGTQSSPAQVAQPTQPPTQAPTAPPTQAPTEAPTQAPTQPPTQAPTQPPTQAPTEPPTEAPGQGQSSRTVLLTGRLTSTAANDTGDSPSDGVTSNSTPEISGRTVAFAKVSMRLYGRSYTTTADADGAYHFSIPAAEALPDGGYVPELTVLSPSGASGSALGAPFVVQTGAMPPVSSWVAPAPGQTLDFAVPTSDSTPEIRGRAEPGAAVRVTVNGVGYTATADAAGQYAVVIPPSAKLADGAYMVALEVTGADGVVHRAAGMPIVVDASAPAVSGGISSGAVNGVSSSDTPTISGVSEPMARIDVLLNGHTYSTTSDQTGKYSVTIPASERLLPGSYLPRIRATDASGNSTVVEGTLFTVLSPEPFILGSLPAGAVTPDGLTTDNTPEINGVTHPGSTVTVLVNGISYTTLADPSGRYTVTVPDISRLPNGTYTALLSSTTPSGVTMYAESAPFTVVAALPILSGGLSTTPGNDSGASSADGVTSNPTPEISGITTPGNTVALDLNGASYSTVADADGRYAIAVPSSAPLPDGTHTALLTSTSPDGVAVTATATIVVDTRVAASSGGLSATPSNDTGPNSGDGVTANRSPEISGTTEPEARVSITLNSKTYSTSADAAGRYAVAVPAADALPDGRYTPQITIVDKAGNSTTLGGTPFTILGATAGIVGGLTHTAANDTGASSSDGMTANATPEISGVTRPGNKVTVLVNGISYYTLADAAGHYAVQVPYESRLPFGTYIAQLTSTSPDGVTATAATAPFTVLTTAPSATGGLTATPANDNGASATDGITSLRTPEISGSTEPGTAVAVTINGKTYTAMADAAGRYAIAIPAADALPDGQHTPSIRTTDAAGNSAVSVGTPFTVLAGNPSIVGGLTPGAANDTGASAIDRITNNSTPEISGVTQPGSTVTVLLNGAAYTTVADAAGHYAVTVPAAARLADGSYTVQLSTTTLDGQKATGSATFSIDTVAPAVTGGLSATPVNDTGVSASDGVTTLRTPEISGGTEANAAVELTVNGRTYRTTADAAGRYAISVPAADALPDGAYTPQLRVTDAAGNSRTTAGTPFTVLVGNPSIVGGLSSLAAFDTGASAADGITSDNTPRLSGATQPGSTVTVLLNGASYTTVADAAGRYAVNVGAALPDGTYTAQLTTTTPAGLSTTSTSAPFTIDTAAPAATGGLSATPANDTGPSSTDGLTEVGTPEISGSTEPGSTVALTLNGKTYTTTADAAGRYALSVPQADVLPNGSYTPQLRVTDVAGNVSTLAGTPFTVQRVAMTLEGGLSQDASSDTGASSTDRVTRNGTPEFSGTTKPGSTVDVLINGITYRTTADASGHYAISVPAAQRLPDGSYTARLTATSPLGEVLSATAAPFTVDSQVPVLTGGLTASPANDTGPSATDGVTSVATPELSGTTEPGSMVIITLNGKGYTAVADAAGRYAVAIPAADALADGSYTPVISVTDLAGNSQTINGSPFTVASRAPALDGRLTATASNDTGSSSSDGVTSQRAPEYSGSTHPGATVAVTINGKTYTTTADAAGRYAVSVPAADALADGSYTPVLTATNAAGVSTTVNGTPFHVRTSGPGISGRLTPGGINDTGASGTDGVTANRTPEISGSTSPNTPVSVTIGGTTYNTVSDSAGRYAVAVPAGAPLADGSYTPMLRATDSEGNSSTVAGTPFTVDTSGQWIYGRLTPVAGNDTGTSSSDGITTLATPQVSGKTRPGNTVTMVLNGKTYTTTADGAGDYAISVPGADALGDGTYTAQLSTTDGVSTGTASAVPFTVDATPQSPVINPVTSSLSPNDVVNAAVKTAGTRVTGLAEANATLVVTWNGHSHTLTADAQGNWSTVFTAAEAPADSPATVISAVATSSITGATSAPATRTVRVDTGSPPSTTATITGVSDDVGTGSAGGYTAGDATGAVAQSTSTDDTLPTLAGTLSAALGADEVVQIFDGNTLLGNASVAGTSWTYTPSAALTGAGQHTLRARVVNTANGLSGTASSYNINLQSMEAPDIAAHSGARAGVLARYLLLQWNLGAADTLSLAELQAIVAGVNVAAGLPAASYRVGPAGTLAGSTALMLGDGAAGTGYASSGSGQTQGWVQIDLGAAYMIDTLRLTPNAANPGRSANLRVYGSTSDMASAIANAATTANLMPALASTPGASLIGVMPAAPAGVTDITATSYLSTDDRPILSGSLGAALGVGEQVAVYEGAVLLGVATVNGSEWNFSPSAPLANGVHALTVVIEDSTSHALRIARAVSVTVAGAPGTTATIASVVDDVASSASTYPAGNGTGAIASGASSDDATPALAGTLSAALLTGEELRIFDGGTLLGTATVTGTNWTFTAPALNGLGLHGLSAQVYNTISGKSAAASAVWNVNLQAMGALQTQRDGAAPPNSTSDTTPSFFGTLGAPLQPGEVVGIYINGARIDSALVSGGNWSYTVPGGSALAPGSHTVMARIEQDVTFTGTRLAVSQSVTVINTGAPAQTATVTGIADATAVTVGTLVSQGAYTVNAATAGHSLDDPRPTVSGTLSAALLSTQILQLFDNGVLLGTVPVAANATTWSVGLASLGATLVGVGQHTFSARVVNTVDGAYNAGGGTLAATFQSMSPILVTPDTGTFTANTSLDPTPVLSGTLGAALSAGEIVGVWDGATQIGTATVDGLTWTYTPTLTAGAHTIKVAIQYTGNALLQRLARTQVINIPGSGGTPATTAGITSVSDNVGPASADGYAAGDAVGTVANGTSTNDTTLALAGSISATLGVGEEVRIYDNGVYLGVASTAGTAWTYTTPALSGSGAHALTARVVNSVTGGGAPASVPWNVVQAGMSAITLRDAGGLPIGAATTDTNPTLSGTLSAPLGAGERIAVYDNGIELLAPPVVVTDSGWSYTPVAALAAGLHTFTVQLESTAGVATLAVAASVNIVSGGAPATTATITGAVDATGVAASGLSGDATGAIASGASTNDASAVLSGTLSTALLAGESLQIFDGAILLGTATAAGTSWTFTPAAPLSGLGQHHLTARVVNNATGLTGAASAPYTLNQLSMSEIGAAHTGELTFARYVMVRVNPATADTFGIGEVKIMSGGTNIAAGKTVTASQAAAAGSSLGAVIDGASNDTGAGVRNGYITSTTTTDGWVQIDLGAVYQIDSIVLASQNQNGTSYGRMANPTILTSASNLATGQTLAQLQARDGVSSTTIAGTPSAAGTSYVPSASDSAWVAGTTPTLTGNLGQPLGAGEQVAVYENGTLLGVATLSGANWSFTVPSAFAAGLHTLTVQVEDTATNTMRMARQRTFYVPSATAPTTTASIASVTDDVGTGSSGGYTAGDATGAIAPGTSSDDGRPTLAGTLSAGLAAGQALQVYDGSTFLGNATVTGTNWTFEPAGTLAAGLHTFRVKVTDTSSGLSGPQSAAATMVTQSLSAISATPHSGGTLWNNIISDSQPILTGSIGAALGTNERVGIYIDGVYAGAALLDGLNWTYEVGSPLSVGTAHTVEARIQDATSGAVRIARARTLTSTSSAAPTELVTITRITDDTSPAGGTYLDGNATGNVIGGKSTDDTSPTIGGTLNALLLAGEVLEVFDGATLLGQATILGSGTDWSYTHTGAGLGTHSYTARVRNAVTGLTGPVSAAATVVETSLSGITITPHTGALTSAGTTDTAPTLSGTLGAPLGSGEQLGVYDGGVYLGQAVVSGTSWSFTPATPLVVGTHSIKAQIEDGATHSVRLAQSTTFNVIGTGAPTATATITAVNDAIGAQSASGYRSGDGTGTVASGGSLNDTAPTMTGSLSAALQTGEVVQILDGGAVIGTATVNGTSWTYTASFGAASGLHNLTARVANAQTGLAGAASPVYAVIENSFSAVTVSADSGFPTVYVPVQARYVMLRRVAFTGTNALGITELTVMSNGVNVALGKAVTIGAQGTSGAFAPSRAVDGLTNSFYQAAAITADDWIEVDLGASYPISSINITPSGSVATRIASSYVMTSLASMSARPVSSLLQDPTVSVNRISAAPPAAGVTFTGNDLEMAAVSDTTPILGGTLGAAIGANEQVAVYDNGVLIGVATVTVSGGVTSWSFTPAGPMAAGEHVIVAQIEDTATHAVRMADALRFSIVSGGAPTATATLHSVIDRVSATYAAGDGTGPVTSGGSIDDTQPLVTGSISAPLATGEAVQVYDGATLLGAATVTGTTWTFQTPVLAVGSHSITARVVNLGSGASSAPSSAIVVQEQVLQGIGVTPDSGAFTNNSTTDTTPTFSGALGTAIGAGERIAVYDNNVYLGDAAVSAGGWSYTPASPLAGGDHVIKVQIEDATSKVVAMAQTQNVTIVAVAAPTQTAAISSARDAVGMSGSTYTGSDATGSIASGVSADDARPVLTGSISATLQIGEVLNIYDGATLLGAASVTGTSWSYSVASDLAFGAHSLTARVDKPAAYVFGTASPVFSYNRASIGMPSVAVSGGQSLGSGTDLVRYVMVRLQPGNGQLALAELQVMSGGVNVALGKSVAIGPQGTLGGTSAAGLVDNASGTSYSAAASGSDQWVQVDLGGYYSVGSIRLLPTATTANAGNNYIFTSGHDMRGQSLASLLADSGVKATVNGTVPASGATFFNVAPPVPVSDDTTPTLSGAFGGVLGAGERLAVYDGATYLGNATVSGGTWDFTPAAPLAQGRHTLTIQIEDIATSTARLGQQTAVVIAPAGAPATTASIGAVLAGTGSGHGSVSTVVAAGSSTDDAAPVVTGTLSSALLPGQAVQVYDGATLLGLASVSGTGWRFDMTSPLSSGSHSLTARVVNQASGLAGTASAAYTIIETATGFSQVIADAGAVLGDLMASGSTTASSGDSTPTLAGRLLAPLGAGERLALYDGAILLGTATLGADGLSWTMPVVSPLSNGVHNLQARVEDQATGAVRIQSTPFTLAVNTQAPTNVAVVDLVTAVGASAKVGRGSVSWQVTDDGSTDDRMPTVSGTIGTALLGDEVVAIYDGTVRLGTATVSGTTWTYVPTALSTGIHSFTARVENGSAGPGSPGYETRENAITVSSINDGSAHTAPETVRFVTIATDNNSASPSHLNIAAALSVYVDGVDVAAGKKYGATWVGAQAAGGRHYVTVDLGAYYAVDSIVWRNTPFAAASASNLYLIAHRTNASDGFTGIAFGWWDSDLYASVTAFNGPDANTTSYTASAVPRSTIVTSPTPSITGRLAVAMGAGEQLAVYEGATLLGVATIAADGVSWSFTVPTMSVGKHTYALKIEDSTSHAAHVSTDYVVSYDDRAVPTATVAVTGAVALTAVSFGGGNGSIGGTMGTDATHDDTYFDVRGTLSGTLAVNQVIRVYDGATLLGEAQLSSNGTWTYYAGSRQWSAGSHSLTARVETVTGVQGAVSNTFVSRVGGIATTAMGDNVGLEQGNLIANGATSATTDDSQPTLTGTLLSSLGAGEQVAVYDGTTLLGAAVVSGSSWSFTPSAPLADGAHTLRAVIETTATHVAGAVAATHSITVATPVPVKTAVIAAVVDDGTGNVASGGSMSDYTPSMLGTLNAALATGEQLAIFDGGVQIGLATVNGTNWSFTTPAISLGAHALTARVVTAGGQQGPASPAYNVTVTGSTPQQTAAITGVTSDVGTASVTAGVMTADATPNLRGTLSAPLGAGETLGVYDGATLLGNATVSGAAWTYTTPALANGHHLLTVRVDGPGGSGAASSGFDLYAGASTPQVPSFTSVVDDIGPLTGPINNGDTSNDSSFSITGAIAGYTAGEGGTLGLYEGATLMTTATLASNGTWTASINNLPDGAHTIVARFTNAAGVVDANTASFSVTVSSGPGLLGTIHTASGLQTLAMTGAGQTLDLGSVSHARIDDMQIDGSGANTLKLKLSDVLQAGTDLFNAGSGWAGVVSGGRHQMLIQGGSDDTVQLDTMSEAGSWTLVASVSHGGHDYAVYNSTLGQAQVLIEQTLRHATAGAIM